MSEENARERLPYHCCSCGAGGSVAGCFLEGASEAFARCRICSADLHLFMVNSPVPLCGEERGPRELVCELRSTYEARVLRLEKEIRDGGY